jgi:hypothetical protein
LLNDRAVESEMRRILVAALGALLLVITFASEAFAQRGFRGGGLYGGGFRGAGLYGGGFRGAGDGYRGVGWRGSAWRGGWGYRPYRPLLWGAAAIGTAAAVSSYYSYPYGYGYGYANGYPYARSGYGYGYPNGYASYGYGSGYPSAYGGYAYAGCMTPRRAWNGWGYQRVWVQGC